MAKKRGRPAKATSIALVPEKPPEVVNGDVPAIADANALIARAIDKNLPVESMERLLAMRRELRSEWALDRYFEALAKFQRQCPIIGKGKDVKDKYGKHRYSYAPLDVIVETVREYLDVNGFSYTLETKQTADSVTAICKSHHVAGHSESTEFTVPIDPEAYMNAQQKVASALTYASRYAFRNAFGIMTGDEDDDAQEAGEPVRKQKAEDVMPRPAPVAKTETEVAHDNLLALFRQMTALKLYTPEELAAMTEQAKKANGNLGSLLDLYEVWSNDTKERQKK